jgi:SAM-dependent methyltransferase
VCPCCGLNNRQRVVAGWIADYVRTQDLDQMRGYATEQVTAMYQWLVKALPVHCWIGSEYLGNQYKSGEIDRGILHQDIEALSFENESFDLLISNDVMEHVPHPFRAMQEMARVLRPLGKAYMTFPFYQDKDLNVSRSKIDDEGQLVHLLPPEYHGNPVSSEGSLVFTDFGWEVLAQFKEAGFSDGVGKIIWSYEYGNLGGGQILFEMTK